MADSDSEFLDEYAEYINNSVAAVETISILLFGIPMALLLVITVILGFPVILVKHIVECLLKGKTKNGQGESTKPM